MGTIRGIRLIALVLLMGGAISAGRSDAKEETDCLTCHGELIAGQKPHAAVTMGCASCHAGIDAAEVPHRTTNSVKRGLLAAPPQLCYGCHDEKTFTNKHVHPALEMGCGSCHNPHASRNSRLLKTPVPELCYECHDRAVFTRKFQHGPVAAGLCLQCHNAHSSRNDSLLVTSPVRLCGQCHTAVLSRQHLLSSTDGKGHPVGAVKETTNRKGIKDPVRKGKRFCCISCHDPHSANADSLVRFPMNSPMDICGNCHTGKM